MYHVWFSVWHSFGSSAFVFSFLIESSKIHQMRNTREKKKSITRGWFGNYWPSFPPPAVRTPFRVTLGQHQRRCSSPRLFSASLPGGADPSFLLQNSLRKRTDSSGCPALPQNPPRAQGIHSWGSSRTHSLFDCLGLTGKGDGRMRMGRSLCLGVLHSTELILTLNHL